jgi:xanthine dehydrogenase iron-sulfur cluster and FAD-binding subunit A
VCQLGDVQGGAAVHAAVAAGGAGACAHKAASVLIAVTGYEWTWHTVSIFNRSIGGFLSWDADMPADKSLQSHVL